MFDLENFSESTLANNSNDFKVLKFGDIVVLALMNELWSVFLLLSLGWTSHTLLDFLVFHILFLLFRILLNLGGVLLFSKVFVVIIVFHFFLFDLLFD